MTEIAADGAANREPCAVFDLSSPQLIWSQLGADGRWTLRRAVLAGGVWGSQSALLQAGDQPAAGTDGDREPSALAIDANHVRIFFRSDRSGGPQLWSTVLNAATGTADPPVRLTSGAAHCSSPTALAGPDGRAWLVHRSDANVPLARVGVDPVPQPLNRVTQPEPAPRFIVGAPRSGGAEELGARRRFAGSTSLHVHDAARFGRRRDWEDLIAYTPQRTVVDPRTMSDDDLYTRGTVGLYLSPTISDDPLTEPTVQRLRGALARFLAAPVRTVVVLKPNVDIEVVYGPARDIGEQFVADDFPFAESYAGAAEASVTVALPDWAIFHSAAPPTSPTDHTADPAVLTTLRSRTWFPPPV